MTARFTIRRMVMALDPSAAARASLPQALRLAARFEAKAEGLFVEDARLMAACIGEGLPSGHVSRITGLPESLDAGAMEAGLRAQTAMLSRHVSATAAAVRCQCALRIVRGTVAEALVSETEQGDLLVLSRRVGHVGAVLAATARSISAPTLILPPGESPDQGRIVVLADTVGFLERALAAVERFLNGSHRRVEIVLSSQIKDDEAERLVQAISLPVRARFAKATTDLSACIPSDTGLVIVSPDNAALSGIQLTHFLQRVTKPVLLMQ
ncbi:MAG: hypothetical protein P1U65_04365 [Minwuia sp.]|nr:hypothetical protein [Minwuia sp.]